MLVMLVYKYKNLQKTYLINKEVKQNIIIINTERRKFYKYSVFKNQNIQSKVTSLIN